MARSKKKDEEAGFRPIVVEVHVNESFRPVTVGEVAPAADTKKNTPKPAAGTRED